MLYIMILNDLKNIRKNKAISQQALAKSVGVTRQTIHAVEASKSDPSLELALKICQYLGLPIEKVFKLSPMEKLSTPVDDIPPFSIFGKHS
jgi:putative transcriptional regulator